MAASWVRAISSSILFPFQFYLFLVVYLLFDSISSSLSTLLLYLFLVVYLLVISISSSAALLYVFASNLQIISTYP